MWSGSGSDLLKSGATADWRDALPCCRFHALRHEQLRWLIPKADSVQSVALTSLLCPSVHSEGWLSFVCAGDHSHCQAGSSLAATVSWQRVQRPESSGGFKLDWWNKLERNHSKLQVSVEVGGPQWGGNFYLSPAINPWIRPLFCISGWPVGDISSFQC